MESKEQLYALISAYLAGGLSEEDRKLVEERCGNDTEFAEVFRLQAQAEYVVYAHARDKKREELNQMFDLMQGRGEISKGRSNIGWIAGIAAAAVIAVLFLFFWQGTSPQTPEELYATYVSLDQPKLSFKRIIKPGEDNNAESEMIQTWEAAAQAFNEGDYDQSQQLISEVLGETPFVQRETARFFLGLSFLLSVDAETDTLSSDENLKLRQAIDEFEKVDPLHLYKENAIWYTALAYLKMNDLTATKEQLNKVISFESNHREDEARELLNRIAK